MIGTLNEAIALIDGRKDFVVKHDVAGYSVVDYVIAAPDTFDHGRHELRGLKFGPDGRVIARPLHKFFNVGERPETQPDAIDWSRPHVITEKLDGSMVHPAIVQDDIRMMTRMGITDVARAAERSRDEAFLDAMWDVLQVGITPIFEWTSPGNRIVVGYDEDRFTLLAARDTLTGTYVPRSELPGMGYPVPRVLATDAYGDWAGLARYCEGLEDAEGFVVWFADGQAVKVKAPWYVTRHRALDGLRWEHDVTRMVLEGAIDDVIPLLSQGDRSRLGKFAGSLDDCILATATAVDQFVRSQDWPNRGSFAEAAKLRFDGIKLPLAFRVYDGHSARETLVRMALDRCNNQRKCAEVLGDIGARRW